MIWENHPMEREEYERQLAKRMQKPLKSSPSGPQEGGGTERFLTPLMRF